MLELADVVIQSQQIDGCWRAFAQSARGPVEAGGLTEQAAIAKVRNTIREIDAKLRWDSVWGIPAAVEPHDCRLGDYCVINSACSSTSR